MKRVGACRVLNRRNDIEILGSSSAESITDVKELAGKKSWTKHTLTSHADVASGLKSLYRVPDQISLDRSYL